MKRRWIAILLAISLLFTAGLVAFAEEPEAEETLPTIVETSETEEALPPEEPAEPADGLHYVALGDSCGAGVGLPAYMQRVEETGRKWIAAERIEGSYPYLVAEALEAGVFDQYHFPGARTADIRYLLDGSYSADWVLTGQAAVLSEGTVSKQTMDACRTEVITAIADADVITLDVGINDCWLPVIAAIYDIAGEGRSDGSSYTVPELVQKYGSLLTVTDNAASYLRAWMKNPLHWPSYLIKLSSALIKWAVDYQINISAIMDRIYSINPDAELLVCGMYNPVQNWGILPFSGDKIIQKLLQPYYNMLNLRKQLAVKTYKGSAQYIDMTGIELVSDSFTIPLFEFNSLDDSGYNPHPTAAGAQDQASRILAALA